LEKTFRKRIATVSSQKIPVEDSTGSMFDNGSHINFFLNEGPSPC
jgi:hypothetical protein